MATHDYVISNQSFPSTRTDINNVLQAIVSSNSNATAPSTTYANMIWYDTANNKLYIRNEDNDAWIELFVLDQTGDHLEKIGDTITLDGTGNMSLAGDLTVDTSTLKVDSTNNRVGILEASPTVPLEVKGAQAYASSASNLLTSTTKASAKIRGSNDASAALFFGSLTNDAEQYIQSCNGAGSAADDLALNPFGGNVGIGLVSPDTPLEIQRGSSGNALKLSSSADGASVFLAFEQQESGTKHVRGRIRAASSGVEGGLIFETGASSSTSERMRILSNGHVLINRSSEIGTTFLNIGGVSSSVNGIGVQNGTDSATVFSFFIRNASASTIGSISNNGSTTSFNTTSDYRLKENVTDITDGITRLKLLNPSRFNFIADADTTVDGFLAHEVSDIVPEAITGEKDAMMDEEYVATPATGEIYTPAQEATYDADGNELTAATNEVVHSTDVEKPDTLEEGRRWRETTEAVMATRSVPDYQGIDQAKLVPLLTAALQEAVAKIEALETRVAALEA